MSRYKISPIDLTKTQSYSLSERPSKVTIKDFAHPYKENSTFSNWLANLPNILAIKELKGLAKAVVDARQKGRAVIVGLGGHVIKCGLAPILIDLIERGFITGVAINGSAAIHDFEVATVGFTSEDVDSSLGKGDFGMAEETGAFVNLAAEFAAQKQIGLGEALGAKLQNAPNSKLSLIFATYQQNIPLTVHLAIGTDIVHIHKLANGASLGVATHYDFRLFCSEVIDLTDGGVYLNLGSAVLMPEVFLKAVTVVRNLGLPLKDFTTANLDFIQHYRPLTNVVKRPVAGVGRGYSLTGHHEILIPLLAATIIELSADLSL
jgi:hypothetical protein